MVNFELFLLRFGRLLDLFHLVGQVFGCEFHCRLKLFAFDVVWRYKHLWVGQVSILVVKESLGAFFDVAVLLLKLVFPQGVAQNLMF